MSRGTGQARTTTSGEQGEYRFQALLSGEYAVIVECAPFQRTVRASIVEAGSTTTTDFALHAGNLRDAVTVHAASPQMHYESPTVSGVVTHDQIESVPLNGRGFLDGGSVRAVALGGAQINVSQEVVPVIPRCRSLAEASDPAALCSLGAINVHVAPYRFTYSGLIARIDRRLWNGIDFNIPTLTLPPGYSFGDNFHSLDLRLSRSFVIRGRTRLPLIAEAFNVFNAANLAGYTGDLRRADFGQPTSRVTQIFGSGGPRAVQVAARLAS